MGEKEQYEKGKTKLLSDTKICKENREWFKEFLEFEEKKGKRSNGIPMLDVGCYRTLLSYIQKFRNVNKWFLNKPLKKMSDKQFEKELERIYEGLEEGKITNRSNKIFADRESYYSKVFKGVPFDFINKRSIASKVIKYSNKKEKEVRFFEEEEFKKNVEVAINPSHKTMLWVLWDIGENIGAILQTTKRDYTRKISKETNEPEYHLNLRKEILKRSRTPRTEITNYHETVTFLDIILKDKKDDDLVFNFGMRQAEKIFERCIRITGTKTIPSGKKPTLKDIRSSMACHLLNEDWTTDEIKSRLGHKPSSNVIDCYVTYRATHKRKPKKKIYDSNLKNIEKELEETKEREKLQALRNEKQNQNIEQLKKALEIILGNEPEIKQKLEVLENTIESESEPDVLKIASILQHARIEKAKEILQQIN